MPHLTAEVVDDLAARLAAGTVPADATDTATQVVERYRLARDLEGNARRGGHGRDPQITARVAALDAMAAELHDALTAPARPLAVDGWRRGVDGAEVAASGARILDPTQHVADLYARSDRGDAYTALGLACKSIVGTASAAELSRLGSFSMDMTTAGGGGVLVPEPIAGFVIDALRARTVVIALGARTVPMASKTLRVPRVTADPAPAWLDEGATITPGDGDMDGVDLTTKRLTAIVKFSDELDEDSDPQLSGEVLANSLARAFAAELDRAALRGSGVDPEPAGVRNQTGVTVTAATGAASWDTLATLASTLTTRNVEPTGFVWSPRTEAAVSVLKASGTGEYMQPPAFIADVPRRSTSSIPTNLGAGSDSEIYAGDWSQLLIGMRVQFELRRLVERYAEEGKVALRARIRADVQLAHGAAFAVATGVSN